MNLWDWKANFYDLSRNLFPFSLILTKETENLKELILQIRFKDGKILDVGTGTGTVLHLFPNNVLKFAVDNSLTMINRAKQKHQVNYIVADSSKLPFESLVFEVVCAVGLFEYQKTPLEFLNELRRVLTPNGFIILTYSQRRILNYLRNLFGHHIYLQSCESFNRLLKLTGFSIKILGQSLLQRQVLLQKNNAEKSTISKI